MSSGRLAKRARPAGLDAQVSSLDLAALGGDITCMAVGAEGTRFVCTESALFALSKCGMQALLAGHKTETGFEDGDGNNTRFNGPCGITVDGDGNHALRKVTRQGAVSMLAGNREEGFADGVGEAALFNQPCGIVVNLTAPTAPSLLLTAITTT